MNWGGARGREAWKWRRLWAWEEDMVVECRDLLLTVVIQVDFADVWQ